MKCSECDNEAIWIYPQISTPERRTARVTYGGAPDSLVSPVGWTMVKRFACEVHARPFQAERVKAAGS